MDESLKILGMTLDEITEAKRWMQKNNYTEMISELATLHAKVAYYERYIGKLNEFRNLKLEAN